MLSASAVRSAFVMKMRSNHPCNANVHEAFVRRRGAKKKANFSSLHFYVEFDTSGANFLRMREVYCKSEFDLLHFYDVFFTWGAAFVRRCVTSDTWVAGSLHFLQWF